MDRVFRIRQWKSAGIIMPDRWSEYKKDNRLIYDDERLYEKKKAQLKRVVDRSNQEYCRLAITGEEFIDSCWKVVYHYPEAFKFEDYL